MDGQPLTVGRGADRCRLVLSSDKSISRSQLTLTWQNGHMLLTDNSTYGTYVNGRRAEGVVELQQNDTLHMGNSDFMIQWSLS